MRTSGAACYTVNQPLGLTFYCSKRTPSQSQPAKGFRRMRLARPRMTRLLGSVAVAALLGLALAGCKTTGDDITGSIGSPAAPRSEADWRRAARHLGRALPGRSERRRGGDPLRPGAARHRPARAGRRGARAGVAAQSAGHGAARRLWPRARRCRQLQPGARRARPRAHAGPAGLAHPLGAGRGARPDGPARRSAAVLRGGAPDRAGRAVGAVQSRTVLRALQGL